MGIRTKIQSKNLDDGIVKDFQVDWGITADDINAADMPIMNTAGRFKSSTVEDTLNELNLPVGTILMFDAENSNGTTGNSATWTDDNTARGWYACIPENSDFSCPDLTDKFLMGKVTAGTGATGGSNTMLDHTHSVSTESATHTHNTVMGSHHHRMYNVDDASPGGVANNLYPPQGDNDKTTSTHYSDVSIGYTNLGTKTSGTESANHTHTVGSGDAVTDTDNRPAFYSVIYIRKCY